MAVNRGTRLRNSDSRTDARCSARARAADRRADPSEAGFARLLARRREHVVCCSGEHGERGIVEEDERDTGNRGLAGAKESKDLSQRNPSGGGQRIPVDAGADGGQRQRAGLVLCSQLKTPSIARFEGFRLAAIAIPVDGVRLRVAPSVRGGCQHR